MIIGHSNIILLQYYNITMYITMYTILQCTLTRRAPLQARVGGYIYLQGREGEGCIYIYDWLNVEVTLIK